MALEFFSKKPKALIGIDIGSKNIKIVELIKQKERMFRLTNYAIGGLEGLDIRKASVEVVAEVVGKIITKAGIFAKNVVMSLPAYSTFLSLVPLPEMSDEELDEAVSYEARKYIPVAISEVTLGWSRSHSRVLLIAVPKKLSERYVQIASLMNLKLMGLEAETFSLTRSLARDQKGLVLVIDKGAFSTNLSLVLDGSIISNQTINEKVSLLSEITSMTGQAKQSLLKIILAGGEINQETVFNLQKVVGEKTMVAIADPWQDITYPKEIASTVNQLSGILSVAVGLAMRDYE